MAGTNSDSRGDPTSHGRSSGVRGLGDDLHGHRHCHRVSQDCVPTPSGSSTSLPSTSDLEDGDSLREQGW